MKLKSSTFVAIAMLAFGSLIVAGCSSNSVDTPTGQGVSSDADKPVQETPENMGETVAFKNEKGELVCPVQGDVIPSEDKAAGFQDFKGKRYYFCCAGCPEAFAADPEKYAK